MVSPLDIDQLQTFVAISDAGSFTKAADRVFKTQSAVSMQMRRLEERIRKPLFVKDGRGNRLTPEGEKLLNYARRIIRLNNEAVAAFAPNRASAVVTLSHDIKIDDPALAAALARPTGYVGALGSRANQVRRLERLGGMGIGAEDLARIDGPAGIALGGLGPQEIALSIAAGMVKALRGR